MDDPESSYEGIFGSDGEELGEVDNASDDSDVMFEEPVLLADVNVPPVVEITNPREARVVIGEGCGRRKGRRGRRHPRSSTSKTRRRRARRQARDSPANSSPRRDSRRQPSDRESRSSSRSSYRGGRPKGRGPGKGPGEPHRHGGKKPDEGLRKKPNSGFRSSFALSTRHLDMLKYRVGESHKVESGKQFVSTPVLFTLIELNHAREVHTLRHVANGLSEFRMKSGTHDRSYYGPVWDSDLPAVLTAVAGMYAPAAQGLGSLVGHRFCAIVPNQACGISAEASYQAPPCFENLLRRRLKPLMKVCGSVISPVGDWRFLQTHSALSVSVTNGGSGLEWGSKPRLQGGLSLDLQAQKFNLTWKILPGNIGVPECFVVWFQISAYKEVPVDADRWVKYSIGTKEAVMMREVGEVVQINDRKWGLICLPAKIVAEVTLAAQETMGPKAWKSVFACARNHVRRYGRDNQELSRVIPRVQLAVARYAMEQALENAKHLAPLQRKRAAIEKANTYYEFPTAKLPLCEIVLLILLLFSAVSTLVLGALNLTLDNFPAWPCLIQGALTICGLTRGLVVMSVKYRPFFVPVMRVLFVLAFLITFGSIGVPAVLAQDSPDLPPEAGGTSWWRPVLLSMVFVFALVVEWARRRLSRVDEGEAWCRRVDEERQVFRYSGKLPIGRDIRPLESTYDLRKVELNPRAEIQFDQLNILPLKNDVGEGAGLTPIFMFYNAVPICYSRSDHNCYVSCLTRACISMPGPTRKLRELVEMAQSCSYQKLTLGDVPTGAYRHNGEWVEGHEWLTTEEYIQKFPKKNRRRLQNMLEKIRNGDYRKGQLAYKGFVKREKLVIAKETGFEPYRPRMIQGLSDLAKLKLGPFFDQVTFSMKAQHNLMSHLWYTCGATTFDYSEWFEFHHDRLAGDVMYFYSDFSKYDVTQCPELIDLEIEGYIAQGILGADPDDPEFIRCILQAMKHSKVYYRDNFWSVPGTRKSGDLNTSSGNSASTARFLDSFMARHGISPREWAAGVLGDDNFGMLYRPTYLAVFGTRAEFLRCLENHAAEWGFRVDPAGITSTLLEAEYVSCRFYPARDSLTGEVVHAIGKKPGRTLAKIGVLLAQNDRRWTDTVGLLKGVLLSVLDTSAHVPFLGPVVRFLLEYLKDVNAIDPDYVAIESSPEKGFLEPCAETYAAFYEFYGLTIEDEATFVASVTGQIARFGLPCVIDAPFMEMMIDADL